MYCPVNISRCLFENKKQVVMPTQGYNWPVAPGFAAVQQLWFMAWSCNGWADSLSNPIIAFSNRWSRCPWLSNLKKRGSTANLRCLVLAIMSIRRKSWSLGLIILNSTTVHVNSCKHWQKFMVHLSRVHLQANVMIPTTLPNLDEKKNGVDFHLPCDFWLQELPIFDK